MMPTIGILLVNFIGLVSSQSLYQFGNIEYKIPEGSVARLPCNITPAWREDKILLIMWYREDTATPIYTIDSRVTSLMDAPHFISDYLQDRVKFQLTEPISYLTIEPIKRIDNGVYRCRVDFRQARTMNKIILLQVIVPVTSIEIHDSNGNEIKDIAGPYNEDDSINITCKVIGGKNGKTLFRKNIFFSHLFPCVALNIINCSNIINHEKSLHEYEPIFHVYPYRLQKAYHLGFPRPEIAWEQNGQKLDKTKYFIFDDFVESTVFLDNLDEKSLFNLITCKATNTNLTVPLSKSFRLDLNLKPKELELTKPENLIANVTIELTCSCKGSRPGALIRWYKDEGLINSSETFFHSNHVNMGSTTTTVSILQLKPSIADNGKRLSCSAINPKLRETLIEEGFHLNVQYKPIVNLVLGSQNKDIREGSLILFECNTQANPASNEIGWIFNGATLNTRKMDGILVTPNTLLIENVTRHHRGHYSCSASNTIGTTSSEPLFLDVLYKPFCKWIESKYLGTTLYKNVDLECQVISHPGNIEFQWILQRNDGTTINLTPNYTIETSKSTTSSSSTTAPLETITSRLTFFTSTGSDFGSIYCKANNEIGWQEDPCIFYIYPEENAQRILFNAVSKYNYFVYKRSRKITWIILITHFMAVKIRKGCKRSDSFKLNLNHLMNQIRLAKFGYHVYSISISGPPEAPTNCTMRLINVDTQLIQCQPNFDGGLDQIFHLDIYNRLSGDLIQNLSSKSPSFELKSNISRGDYNLVIYSANILGESSKVDLQISSQPIHAWPDFFGEEPSTESFYKISISFFCALITILATIFMVLRFCLFKDKDKRCFPTTPKSESIGLDENGIKSNCLTNEEPNMITSVKIEDFEDEPCMHQNYNLSTMEFNGTIMNLSGTFGEIQLYHENDEVDEEEKSYSNLTSPDDPLRTAIIFTKRPTCIIASVQYPEDYSIENGIVSSYDRCKDFDKIEL
uniref:Ig-like domain-containing protein n=1 Tax=Tetranychus urticae TaxID=32264 RepID=T1KG61_TETUR